MKTLSELNQETDQLFEQLSRDKPATQHAYQYILSTLDDALAAQNYDNIVSLIRYIEEGDGRLAYRYIGESHRILRVLHIIESEQKFQKTLFCTDCKNFSELRAKYMLTLFALRRLLFRLSAESVLEAVQYLRETPISVIAAYIMTQDELLIPSENLYEDLIGIYAEIWSAEEVSQFLFLIKRP